MVNILLKALMIALFCIMSGSATTITFNGCSNTPNDYFTFTSSGNEYCIAKCIPKLNPESATTVTLKIPGSVNRNQVSLGAQSFNWESYTDFSNLQVRLVFEAVNDSTVQMPANCSNIFKESGDETGASKVSIDLTGIQSSGITNMRCMFWGCCKLESVDISFFDTSNVTDMMSLFSHCSNLKTANISGLDTSKVTTMRAMFYGCHKLESVDVSSFDTSNVTTMLHMFLECSSLKTLDLINFDTSKVTDVAYMFKECAALKNLKVSDTLIFPDLENTDVRYMFLRCNASLRITGSSAYEFIEAGADIKNLIDTSANKNRVYVSSGGSGISGSLRTIAAAQLSSPVFEEEFKEGIDTSNLFGASSGDAVYIGMNALGQTIVVNGSNRTISGALINKAIDGIGYYPANFRLTGTISLSGDNSEFNQKSFLVGDGISDTIITLTNPNALPRTNTTVEPLGTLVFGGSGHYTLINDITIKSGGKLNAIKRIMLSGNGVILQFEN